MHRLFQAGRGRSPAVVAVLAIMLLAGAGRAKADQITTTSQFTDYNMGEFYDVSLLPFDPRMGTLIGAKVSIEATYNSAWRLYINGSGPQSIPYGVNVLVDGPGLLVSQDDIQSQSIPSLGSEWPPASDAPISMDASQTISGNDLGLFIGNRYDSVSYGIEFSPLSVANSEGSVAMPLGGPLIGSISITYTYLPVGFVPEPSGLALSGIALVVLAGGGCLAKPRRRAARLPAN